MRLHVISPAKREKIHEQRAEDMVRAAASMSKEVKIRIKCVKNGRVHSCKYLISDSSTYSS